MSEYVFYAAALPLSAGINYLLYKIWNVRKIDVLRSLVKTDRWGSRRVPLTGGIVVALLFFSGCLLAQYYFRTPRELAFALAGSAAMFALGLADDLLDLKSYQKLVGQIGIIMVVMTLGVQVTLVESTLLNLVITFFWMLVLTNAFNLLDNMDGLAGGIALIAFVFLGIQSLQGGAPLYAFLSLLMVAVLLGFLVFNFKPAKIYLGDSGALLIGFLLSALTVLGAQRGGKSLFSVVIFPVVLMAIPIFDTLLVSITRKIRGQSPLQGGKDHLSHRLVMIGMSERQAVLFLYGVSIVLGFSILMLHDLSLVASVVIYFFVSVLILLFGLYVGKIRITTGAEAGTKGSAKEQRQAGGAGRGSPDAFALPGGVLYKYNILQMLIDLVLLGACYYFAYVIRFGARVDSYQFHLFLQSVPFVVMIKVVLLYAFGAYSRSDGYTDFSDIIKIIKSIAAGSVVIVLGLTFLFRFERYSRAVFLIDWMLSMIVIGGVRYFYRFFEELFYPFLQKKKRAITFVGDRDTYRALQSYLRIKEGLDYRIRAYVPVENRDSAELGAMKDRPSGIVVVEDKYREIVDRLISESGRSLEVYRLSEFLASSQQEERRISADD